jgi:muramoyltetrapeptide carboxypeptidase
MHLTAPAGSCRPFLKELGMNSAGELIAAVQEMVGSAFLVTGDPAILEVEEDELHGGRRDDRRRADDLTAALRDDEVACVVALRGGAWLTRVIPRIDFSVLDRRRTRITLFGFSELTTLVNLVGAHPRGVGVYDLSPAFLTYGLARRARLHPGLLHHPEETPNEWMQRRLLPELRAHFADVVAMAEGRGTRRVLTARWARGSPPPSRKASFIGGNLCVFTTLLGTPYQRAIAPRGRWLVLEDINEKPERVDRFLARLTLAGYFDECEGLLLGDFHQKDRTLTQAVINLLDDHLPSHRELPVLVSDVIGHIWPMAPLPLHRPVQLQRTDDATYTIHWDGRLLGVP